jgi:hypothetical protein
MCIMKHKKLAVVLFITIVVVAGTVAWMMVGRKAFLSEASNVENSSDWSGSVDQPPPSGFSYGEADPNQPLATREQVIARANKFYIDKLGEENFRKYYERLPQRDAFSSLPESAFDFIGYVSKVDQANDYDTAKYEDPSDAVQFVQVNRTNLKEVYGSVPDCVADAHQCDYKVTKQQAIDIARKDGLSGELVVKTASDNKGRYFLEVTSCQDKKAVHIDYSTGKAIRNVEGCKPFVID